MSALPMSFKASSAVSSSAALQPLKTAQPEIRNRNANENEIETKDAA